MSSQAKKRYHVPSAPESEDMRNVDMQQKVSELVRYLLFMDKKKTAIKKQDICKAVLKEQTKLFEMLFAEAKKRLEHVFGITVVECESNSKAKSYILTNNLNIADENIFSSSRQRESFGLLMITLSLIYMSSGLLSDEVLKRTLKGLGIQSNCSHPELGNLDKNLQDFTKQGYIVKEKIQGPEGPSFQYKLGSRSLAESSKRRILEFVSEIYCVDIKQWKMQYNEILAEDGERNS